MVPLSIEKLKVSPNFIENIRFDITPRLFVDPKSAPGGKPTDITYGYMLYIDLMDGKPILMIMQLKQLLCKTVGSIHDVPEELLKEAVKCGGPGCAEGMYPLSEELKNWLKKELGIS